MCRSRRNMTRTEQVVYINRWYILTIELFDGYHFQYTLSPIKQWCIQIGPRYVIQLIRPTIIK